MHVNRYKLAGRLPLLAVVPVEICLRREDSDNFTR